VKRHRKLQPLAINPLVVDLSHHNDVADFGKVKASGIAGIIHKATEATGFADKMYADATNAAGEMESATTEAQPIAGKSFPLWPKCYSPHPLRLKIRRNLKGSFRHDNPGPRAPRQMSAGVCLYPPRCLDLGWPANHGG
jgi:Glycosyl hydrolases family 25